MSQLIVMGFKGAVYVLGLNFLILIFFHKNKVFTVTFQTNKKSFKKSKYSLRNWEKVFGCGVCFLVNFFFKHCFHKVYFCSEGSTKVQLKSDLFDFDQNWTVARLNDF